MQIGLIGNPNAGKTTLFNALTGSTAHVGNWPGVTVEKREGVYRKQNIGIVDLPGLYSLYPYSPEEQVAVAALKSGKLHCVIHIVDVLHAERSLYLTTQLMELGLPLVIALNMMDTAAKNGIRADAARLQAILGVPVVPISARKGQGLERLMQQAQKAPVPRPWVCTAGQTEEQEADARYRAVTDTLPLWLHKPEVLPSRRRTERLDALLTHRFWGIPLFLFLLGVLFHTVFSANFLGLGLPAPGVFLQAQTAALLQQAEQGLSLLLSAWQVDPWLCGLVLEGIFGGVCTVLSFLPQILLLYLALSVLEDTGYMARAAFLMDRLLRRFGLSGKAFMPMLMGFGCSVPALLGTRTLSTPAERRLAVLLIPFFSCGAKLPIWAVFAAAFFPRHGALVLPAVYLLGILMALLSALLLQKTVLHSSPAPFLLELPLYRLPRLRGLWQSLWEKLKDFVGRAATTVTAATALIWCLSHLSTDLAPLPEIGPHSLLGGAASLLAPLFAPLGFGTWQAVTALLSGLIAKEMVVSTLTVLAYPAAAFSLPAAVAFMAFVLLCPPCMAAVAAAHGELQSKRWTAFALLFWTGTAYALSLLLYTLLQ